MLPKHASMTPMQYTASLYHMSQSCQIALHNSTLIAYAAPALHVQHNQHTDDQALLLVVNVLLVLHRECRSQYITQAAGVIWYKCKTGIARASSMLCS